MTTATSCGVLLFRIKNSLPEFFLVHPGGIYNVNALWGIPKGGKEKEDDDYLETAIREFNEEVGANIHLKKKHFIDLGHVKQNKHKTVYCFAYQYDLGDNYKVKSNMTEVEFPRNSGIMITVPEIDDGKYFSMEKCKEIIVNAQFEFIKRLAMIIVAGNGAQ